MRFSSLYGYCEKFRVYQAKLFLVFKLTALCSFIIKGTGLLSFVFTVFGSITKGIETQHFCLRFFIQYSKGDKVIILDLV